MKILIALAAMCIGAGAAQAADCVLSKSTPWTAAGKGYEIDGITSGPDCGKAVALIVVRDGDAKPLWMAAFDASQVMVLANMATPADMAKALTGWIDPTGSTIHTSADFPAWAKGAQAPNAGEFPFMPAEGIDQKAYEAIRARKLPAFCYVQGMESLACVVVDHDQGSVTEIGIQTFPG